MEARHTTFEHLRWHDYIRGLRERYRLTPKLESKRTNIPITRAETESIKVKIRKANMLIDRVKEALDGIRFKEKGSSTSCTCVEQEQSTKPNTATTDSDKENDCCFIIQQSKEQLEAQLRALELATACSTVCKPTPTKTTADLDPSRPKTRRCDLSDGELDVEDRYRTTPGTRAPAVSRIYTDFTTSDDTEDTLQVLKAKLNAISEQATETTESESEKLHATCIAACNTLTIQTTTSATNTDPPSTMCTRESQWSPCGMQKGTQSFTPASEKSLQTDQQKKALLTRHTVENADIPPICHQVKTLVIQSLPPIDVKFHHRRMQSLLHYSIENNETRLLFKNQTCNVAFQLAKSADFTDDQKPVEVERGRSLLRIVEKGKKMHSSENMIQMGTPSVAKRILELQFPDEDLGEPEEDEQEALEEETEQDTSPLPVSTILKKTFQLDETKKSVSEVIEDKDESEEIFFRNKMPEKESIPEADPEILQPPERERVLRSYHIYDNINPHDPGVLNQSSLELVSKVDENVYRTYINPSGFQKPPPYERSNPTVNRTNSAKKCGLSKMSSLRIVKTPPSGKHKFSSDGNTWGIVGQDAVEGSKGNVTQGGVPKIWSLGFYANKFTQVGTSLVDPCISNPQSEGSQPVQNKENPTEGEERALKVINFTHSTSRFQLTNTDEDYPAQLQAERDEDPAYQPIGCDGRCSQWAADLRTVITSIRDPEDKQEVEEGKIENPPNRDIDEETKSVACCSLAASKVGVQVSHNTKSEMSQRQESIMRGRQSPKLQSWSDQHTSREQASKRFSGTTTQTKGAEENEDDKEDPNSNRQHKQSETVEDGSKPTLVEYRTMNGSQFETISLTVSYSTGDSVEVNNSPGVSVQNNTKICPSMSQGPSKCGITIIPSQKSEFKSKSQLNKSVNQITDKGKVVLRALKDKLEVEHAEQTKQNDFDVQIDENAMKKVDVSEEMTAFISELTKTASGELKKVLPIIRSRKSLSKTQDKSKHKPMYDVNYVFGDFRQPKVAELLAKKTSKQNGDPLKVAGNGRYKDEAQLFTKRTTELGSSSKPKTPPTKQVAASSHHAKPEPQVVRRIAKHAEHHKHKRKNNFKLETTSNSETITTERSKSEGELTSCQCVVSNGELHSCRYDQFHRRNPPIFNDADELVTTIRKKRSYFNNCVTYYLKRTPIPGPPYSSSRNNQQNINDSSISSNTFT